MLDESCKTFIIYIIAFKAPTAKMVIHSSQTVEIVALNQNEAPTKVSSKYIDYTNLFSFKLVMKLLENTDINEHAIKLKKDKQLSFGPI